MIQPNLDDPLPSPGSSIDTAVLNAGGSYVDDSVAIEATAGSGGAEAILLQKEDTVGC